ncbi:MAG: outer membrane protein assembly factor BamA [Puniceicoccales bacterium]|jgi:outer membrane protein insertion porin family|nr:outer membrane protein assembly factor BamA [Puniceicoccales bacterium]
MGRLAKILSAFIALGCVPLLGDGPRVGKVDIRLQGESAINREAILDRIRLREGEPFQPELNDDSIRALHATNLFEHIEVLMAGKNEDGALDICYVLYPKQRIAKVCFTGNQKFSEKKLRLDVQTKANGPLDWARVRRDVEAVEKLYRDRGHADVRVTADLRPGGGGNPDLVLSVEEGERLTISSIKFVGNATLSQKILRRQMTLRPRGPLSFFKNSGYLQPEQLDADLEQLRTFYHNQGFLDARIDRNGVEIRRKERGRLEIVVKVDEGQRFFFGKISFDGNRLYSDEQLARVAGRRRGEPFSPAAVDAAEEAIHNFYGQRGHVETYAIARRDTDIATNSIDLTFEIHESAPCKVGMVHIQGNGKTRNQVILRELPLLPGECFDLIKLRNGENRLRETHYFSQVSLTADAATEPDCRDVRVNVEEAQTGKFLLGGAASSLDDIVGFVEFSQSNFDLAGRQTRFQGGGQKFRVRLEAGTRSRQAQLNFEEPWLFQRELAIGSDVFTTRSEYRKSDHNYDGAAYSERHRGCEMYLRKRIVGLLEGRAYYRLDRARIYDVDCGAPYGLIIEGYMGDRWISKVGLQVQRDSRDSLLYPVRGNKVVGSIDYAGLGGAVHYFNVDLQAGQWFPVFHGQTISFLGKFGSMRARGGEWVPYFDRKFLGGTGDMRGFDMRGVGPRDSRGEAFGALSYCYGAVEYSIRIAEPLRFVLFGEAAYTGRRWMELDAPLYADVGVEFRLFVMGSPLRLIFGYPLHGDAFYSHNLQFNFTFGTIF